MRTYLKIISHHQASLPGVIPAQTGIHVFQGLKWTPASAGVTVIGAIIDFEIGSSFYRMPFMFAQPFFCSIRLRILRALCMPGFNVKAVLNWFSA